MKIAITTLGSTGDVLPFESLARELVKAGHQVKVCTYNLYADKFDHPGIEFVAVGPAMTWEQARACATQANHLSPLKLIDFLIFEVAFRQGDKYFADCLRETADCDAGICHYFDFLGQTALIKNGIPWASVSFCAGSFKTRYDSPMELPNLGRFVNEFIWWLSAYLMPVAKIQRRIFELTGCSRQIKPGVGLSPDLNLIAVSRHVGKTYPDLPGNHLVTGAWQPAAGAPPVVSRELSRFLAAGRVDVVFHFGSMGDWKGQNLGPLFCEVVQALGLRAVILRGWGDWPDRPSLPNVLFVEEYVSHEALFRHTRAVVHHGGAGTCITAIRHGVVSVVVPHLTDQLYWGKTLWQLGVAPPPIHRTKLTAQNLTQAVRTALLDADMRQRLQALQTEVLAERGTECAVAAIETVLLHKAAPLPLPAVKLV
jgi:UDP:flavonoid glycosyltransferase YjiC (YdhE family)